MEDLVESILVILGQIIQIMLLCLNGEWGSGKTHFWNNKNKKENRIKALNGKRYTTYICLYMEYH